MIAWRINIVLGSLLSVVAVSGQAAEPTAWDKAFSPPVELDTKRVHLEPLKPDHAELDHAAFMSSRAHLRKTLGWGGWPADDATVKANRKDLQRHWKEFENREAYAYTVLSPNRQRCLGCVYLNPIKDKPRTARMAYWVIEEELTHDLDEHLVEAVLDWIKRDWPLDHIVQPLQTANARGVAIAKKLGLRPSGPEKDGQIQYVWQREKE